MKALRIGTRGSKLALWQAEHLRGALPPELVAAVEIVIIKTSGDRFAGADFDQLGIRGVFTKDLEDALTDGRIDLAVHSLKDVPTEFGSDCRVLPIFPREDPRDALVSRRNETLAQLAPGARIGTSSLRRAGQLRAFRVDLEIVPLRGNVDTRLRKLDAGECDGIVLAKAGLERLSLADRITEILPPEIMLPAVGQGALAVEFLAAHARELDFLDALADAPTALAVAAERALLAALQGGCRLPLGAWARFHDGLLHLDACVLSADGAEFLRRHSAAGCDGEADAELLGRRVAQELLEAGAGRLLELAGRSVG